MDSEEPLLLAEGVCRQMQIVIYHPEVLKGRQAPLEKTEPEVKTTPDEVRECQVTLVHTLTLLPHQSANVPVQGDKARGTLFLESRLSESGDLIIEDGLLEFSEV